MAAGAPPDEQDTLDTGNVSELTVDEQHRTLRVKVGGCWYRSLDATAGVRAYYTRSGRVKRFWHGFYNHKAIDHYTGAPVAILITSSSEQEPHSYPRLLEQAIDTVGAAPRAVIGDRGLSVRSVFETNTRLGIASVFPWRKPRAHARREDEDTDRYDRHGIPRCPHCGGPTEYVRFQGGSAARIWFRCQVPVTPECERVASIACSNNYRLLIPLWRNEEAYLALRDTHRQYERAHMLWRSRYTVGADNHATRPKRIGAACQQLRANAALLIEWLRIIDREGWAGSARRNRRDQTVQHSNDGVQRMRRSRARSGLTVPYGPAAVALGIGPNSPADTLANHQDGDPPPDD